MIIILVAIIFITFIVFIILQLVKNKKKINQMRESFMNQQKYNSACCGNADWNLGEKEYKRECPDSTPPAFENTRGSHCSYIRENFTSNYTPTPIYYEKLIKECNKLGHEPAYNQICVQDEKLVTNANCMCSDNLNNCKSCFPKIKLAN